MDNNVVISIQLRGLTETLPACTAAAIFALYKDHSPGRTQLTLASCDGETNQKLSTHDLIMIWVSLADAISRSEEVLLELRSVAGAVFKTFGPDINVTQVGG